MNSVRTFLLILHTVCFLVIAMPGSADETLAIVTQRSSTTESLSFETLKRVYLRKSLLDKNGMRWIPLNLPIDHQLRQGFSLSLFKKTPEDQEDYWNMQYFNGIHPPLVLASEEAILRFIAITPGAIGYVHKHHVDDRVKVLKILSIDTHD